MSRINSRFGKVFETPPCQVVISGDLIAAVLPPTPDSMTTPDGVVSLVPVNNRDRAWNALLEEGEVVGPVKSERHFDNHPLVGRRLPENGESPNRVAMVALNVSDKDTPPLTGAGLWKKAFRR